MYTLEIIMPTIINYGSIQFVVSREIKDPYPGKLSLRVGKYGV